MTCFDCKGCKRKYVHISQLGEFEAKIKIGNKEIVETVWLCKWCMTKAGFKYKVVDDFIEVMNRKSK